MSVAIRIINQAYSTALLKEDRFFRRALRKPLLTQQQLLRKTLEDNQYCAYGEQYGFSQLNSVTDFQKRVPIVSYDDIRPWIDDVKLGKKRCLTHEPVVMFEKTSGSTGFNKYIPYTRGLLRQFSSATNPWIRSLYAVVPELLALHQYWSVSPDLRCKETNPAGIPVGFEDDTDYFGPVTRWALKQLIITPPGARQANSWSDWQQTTALTLMQSTGLGLLSVWSPTYLIALADYISDHWDQLLAELPLPVRTNIERRRHHCRRSGLEFLWPQLRVISCWTDGESGRFIPRLREHFPTTPLQSKGLLATEAVVTIPYGQPPSTDGFNNGSPVAVTSHFFEFIDLNNTTATPKLAHELQKGGDYSPVVTTAGGLYRYRINDSVTCTGHYQGTPQLRFNGKTDRVSDLCGEKLSEHQVKLALKTVCNANSFSHGFFLLAPDRDQPAGYDAFVETGMSDHEVARFADALDRALSESHHYGYSRNLGQLRAVRAHRISNGWATYQNALLSHGFNLGSVKPSLLDYKLPWQKIFIKEQP